MSFIGRVKSFICNKVNILTFIILVLCLIVGILFYCLQQIKAEKESSQISFDKQISALKSLQQDTSRDLFRDFDDAFMTSHFKEFRDLKERMNKLFDSAFSKIYMDDNVSKDFLNVFGETKISNNLNFDIKNEIDRFVVTIKLPNAYSKDVDVKINDQRLTISGDIKEQIKETNSNGEIIKSYSSKFTRSILLPEKVDSNSLTKVFQDGKLTIIVNKSQPKS